MNVRRRVQLFNPGELPLVLLALVEQEPAKAYELIRELDRLFGPAYQPSPGGVYPALKALTDERLLRQERDGRGKRYGLTERGSRALEERRRQLAALEERTGVSLRSGTSLAPVVDRFASRVLQLSGLVEAEDVAAILDDAAERIEQLGGRHDQDR